MPFWGSKPTASNGDASQAAAPAPSQGPGLMGQMAATAGGVAVGNVVGHGLTQAIFGGDESKPAPAAAPTPPPAQAPVAPASCPMHQQPPPPPTPVAEPAQPALCSFEAAEFVRCANGASDLTVCQELLNTLKQCRVNYGLAAPSEMPPSPPVEIPAAEMHPVELPPAELPDAELAPPA